MISPRGQAGFTLIEMLVTMLITMVVFGATLTVLQVFQRDNSFEIIRNETQDNARNAIDRLARDLRNVAAPKSIPELPGALEVAKKYSLIFQTISADASYAWEANQSHAMRVRYCLNNTNPNNEVLWRESQRWKEVAAPSVPATTNCPETVSAKGWEANTRLVEHVSNRIAGQSRQLFRYGPGTEPATAEINAIEVDLFIDPNPTTRGVNCGVNGKESCTETQLTSGMSLRNSNRQPTALFTAQQLGAERRVYLNASESQDPQGLALTYKWWDNGTLLGTTSQQYETAGLVAGSSHTFKLEVTDPGGLESTSEQTLVIK
jgi:prepilin-type N-terminal cleavage/methylation domain-containing protein